MEDLYISRVETSQMNYTNNIHRMSKEDFLKLCSDFYDGNIESNKRRDKYEEIYENFESKYKKIDKDSITSIKVDVEELEEFIESFLINDKKLIEFDKKIKALEYLLSFIGESCNSVHDELWKMKCNGYLDSYLQLEFCKLIYGTEFEKYEYKEYIIYRLTNISNIIINKFNDGDYMISKEQLSIITKLIFDKFLETVNKIKEDIK